MSLRTMPIMFLNMAGEMCYILQQRLSAQSVDANKSSKVIGDILTTMFNRKFLDELFKPQELYARRAMRTFFEKLAHASIMRLNATSMDKLYDLMTMAVKYQLQMCAAPAHLLPITLNHLDGMRTLISRNDPETVRLNDMIDYAYRLLETNYFNRSAWELAFIRATLLNFYQDARVKVSLLLREKRQLDDGHFVLSSDNITIAHGLSAPGTVRYYENGEVIKTTEFPTTNTTYTIESAAPDLQMRVTDPLARITSLGKNMYQNAGTSSTDVKGGVGSSVSVPNKTTIDAEESTSDEIRLLTQLLDATQLVPINDNFALSLFDSHHDEQTFIDEVEHETEAEAAGNVVIIDASSSGRSMAKAMNEMVNVKQKRKGSAKKDRGDDLLDMMDEAAQRPMTAVKKNTTRPRSASRTKAGGGGGGGIDKQRPRSTSKSASGERPVSSSTRPKSSSKSKK